MQTICYMRVSSPKRNGKSRQSTDSQKTALKKYCKQQGIKRPVYIEDYQTGRGKTEDRAGWNQVIEACRQGKCKRVICWKLDRIGRSAVSCMKTISELIQLGITVNIITQNVTFDDSPYSKFLVGIFSLLSEMESNVHAERIASGLQAARERGTTLGRRVNHKRIEQLKRWHEKGVPVKKQAERLSVTPQSVYELRRRHNIGTSKGTSKRKRQPS